MSLVMISRKENSRKNRRKKSYLLEHQTHSHHLLHLHPGNSEEVRIFDREGCPSDSLALQDLETKEGLMRKAKKGGKNSEEEKEELAYSVY
jgi:hypothetical protein